MEENHITPGLVQSLSEYLEERNEEYRALRHSWANGTSRYPSPPLSWPPGRCMLTSLPSELLTMICRPLYQADLFHLALTCRALVAPTIDLLYRRDISDFDCLALRWACTFGVLSTFERTLSYGAPPSHIFDNDSHLECPWRIVDTVFSSGSRHAFSDAPLCTAIIANQPEIVRLLIERGADVHVNETYPGGRARRGLTEVLYPIHLAMGLPDRPSPSAAFQPGNTQIVRLLLDAGADPNQSTQIGLFLRSRRLAGPGCTPLLLAMQSAVPVETAKLLLERGADPIKLASYRGWFYPRHSDSGWGSWDRSPLGAILFGSATNELFPLDMDKTRLLIAHGGAHELTYLTGTLSPSYPVPMLYRHWEHPQVAQVLELCIAHGADIASWAQRVIPPMLSLIWGGRRLIPVSPSRIVLEESREATEKVCKVITLLAEATLDKNYTRSTPSTQKSIIIDDVVAVSTRFQGLPLAQLGQTALRCMCRSTDFEGNLRIIRLLLKYGADMNSPDPHGRTALHHASAFSSGHRVQALVQFLGGPTSSGLIVDPTDERGWTPLHYACLFSLWTNLEEQPFTARLLLENGANVRAKSKNGWTPLSLAALTANHVLVNLLLDYGAHADDLFVPRERKTEPPLLSIGRLVFHDCATYSWPGPCPELLPLKTALADYKTRVATLLSRRLGIQVVLPPVSQTPTLPPDHQFQDRFHAPCPRFRVDRMDHPLGITSKAPEDATSGDFESDIDRLLNKLDEVGLEALVLAPPGPGLVSLPWTATPGHDGVATQ